MIDQVWYLNQIQIGGPYTVWQSPYFKQLHQVNDRLGTVALSCWEYGKHTGAVFTDKETAERLCEMANNGLLQEEHMRLRKNEFGEYEWTLNDWPSKGDTHDR